jgi:integrase
MAASWDQFDLVAAIWTVRTEKAKNKMAHRVPLSPLVPELLKEIRACSEGSAYLFPSPTRNGHITPTAVDHATRKHMDAFRASDQAKGGFLGHFTPHDLRRTAASHMTNMGIPRLVVSKVLNHAESGVTALYDRHSYDHGVAVKTMAPPLSPASASRTRSMTRAGFSDLVTGTIWYCRLVRS